MAELVADCPRCGAQHITFDALSAHLIATQYSWKNHHEVFCICRRCKRSTVFQISNNVNSDYNAVNRTGILKMGISIDRYMDIDGHVSLKDRSGKPAPEHIPNNVGAAFKEGATCMAVECWNAAGAMFRLGIDLATKSLLPSGEADGLNREVKGKLALRLNWLFDTKRLPEALRELARCIKDDGNDGAHDGTLTKADAEDLMDFTTVLLERIYTEPERLKLAAVRRDERRQNKPN